MTATDELRRMLDERGAKWWPLDGTPDMTECIVDGVRHKYRPVGGRIIWSSCTEVAVKPAQAIAATLGPGTCRLHDCGGSFSAVNRPVWRCDCGAFMTQYTDATTYHKPRFCPNCGRKVVE